MAENKTNCSTRPKRTQAKKVLVKKDEPNFTLPPIPSLDCFKFDPWQDHPLLRYNAAREKKRQDNAVLIRRGKKVKNMVAEIVYKAKHRHSLGGDGGEIAAAMDNQAELEAFLTQDDFAEYRRDSVKSSPVIPIQKSWLKRIAALIQQKYKKNHPDLFRELIKEVQDRYEMVLHESILNFVLIPPKGYVKPYQLEIKYPLFHQAPPPWAESYRINRQLIAQNLRRLYPTNMKSYSKMREFMYNHRLFYPERIRDVASNYMRPTELKDIICQQIRNNGELFLAKFIPHLVRIYQNPACLKGIAEGKQDLIMECASFMIVCNATAWATDTITEIVEAYENFEKYFPRVLVDTAIEDQKVTYTPPMEGWMFCFKKIVDEIVNVLQSVPDIADLFWSRFEAEKTIRVFYRVVVPGPFLDVMTERFRKVMDTWLVDALLVADRIYEKFQPILDGSYKASLQAKVQADREEQDFYEFFKDSAILKEYTSSVYDIPKNEFVGWLQVNNEEVIGRLLDSCKTHQNIIADHLNHWLKDHNWKIINGYKEMRDKLLKKPATTNELMELIEYIDVARGVLLLTLKDDIMAGLRMCLAFMDYYLMSTDDMEITVTAHRLLPKIMPAFEKSSIMIEDQKIQFEEQLTKKVDIMNDDLKKLLRRVKEDFGRYGEYDEVPKYAQELKYVKNRVENLQKGIDWINGEEALFKYALTKFEDMAEIMDHLEPYHMLYTVTLKWQRAEKKYLDGDFNLDPDKIDDETQAYYEELEELQTLFKARIKAQKEQEAREKHVPLTLLYDEDNLTDVPPPLKLCMDALASLTTFRDHLRAIRILANPSLGDEHWAQMSEIAGKELNINAGTSLRKLLNLELDEFMDQFEEISNAASAEVDQGSDYDSSYGSSSGSGDLDGDASRMSMDRMDPDEAKSLQSMENLVS